MSPETIRRLDLHLGRPLCAVLTAYRRLSARVAGRSPAPEPRRVLFIKLTEQGAIVLAAGAIRAAVERFGRENVFLCVFPESVPMLEVLDLVPRDQVIPIRHAGIAQFARDVWALLGRARRERIDTTIDLEFFARASVLLAYLCGAGRRVGLHRFTSEAPYRGDLLTDRVMHNPYLHVSKAYLQLVRALDAPAAELPRAKLAAVELEPRAATFEPTPEDREATRALLSELAGRAVEGPLVVLNPNPGDVLPLRSWPLERWTALAEHLLVRFPSLTIAWTGDAAEAALLERMRARAPGRTLNLAGRTPLRVLLTLYSISDVQVTSDSGPGHFASLTEIDNIVLFGPETPALFGPARRADDVVWAGLACSPCLNASNHRSSPCRDNVCMQAISVERVCALVTQRLEARGHRAGAAGRSGAAYSSR